VSTPTPQAHRDWTTTTVISAAHGTSHFFQLLLVPLFPWIKEAFSLSYTQLGFLMTVFYVVSGVGQSISGFVVDKFGARKVLAVSLLMLALVGFGTSFATNYGWLCFWAAVAGLANCPFHPIDFSIMNARIGKERLPMAYSIHAVMGNLGWAFAPIFLLAINAAYGWRAALAGAGVFGLGVLVLVLIYWKDLDDSALRARKPTTDTAVAAPSTFDFLKLPVLWWSFMYFAFLAAALSGFQTFAGEASKVLHGLPSAFAAGVITVYAVAGAAGMLLGGVYTKADSNLERIIMRAFTAAALGSLVLGFVSMPAILFMCLLGAIGFIGGFAQTSRDLLIRRVTPPGATGRVYGFVYSGLDVGIALAPLAFGALLDQGKPIGVWIIIAALQVLLIWNAWKISKASKQATLAAA
jgi:MFS transporter, FSR family, fosmidomycin resistance protein